MPRHKNPEHRTAREEIADVIKWADRQGFQNSADALRRALHLLPADTNFHRPKD
jgi:hypothetical protein